ncbi:hypothetical protein CTI12_AA080050 [Artemisia annua]|uniref:Uncharacterized protein n=1 Tax=Artemisia annua TaxID=35608 RepID=A0A2U1Q314_ARTAN|nr:hypothetical protein CTI12_AA080050 [Artemisia annua]
MISSGGQVKELQRTSLRTLPCMAQDLMNGSNNKGSFTIVYIQAPVTAPWMQRSQEVVNNQVWENHENRKADMELNRIET